VVRVNEFKEKSNGLKQITDMDQFEAAQADLRKDEKKLANIIKK